MKKVIRLTESDIHQMVRNSVKRIINEIGDTKRGQWMLGRVSNRQSFGGGKFKHDKSKNIDAGEIARWRNRDEKGSNSYDYLEGMMDEFRYGVKSYSPWNDEKGKQMQFNYDIRKMLDMDVLGQDFVDFLENYDDNGELRKIMTSNEIKKEKIFPKLVSEFEDYIGQECTPIMRRALLKAYNQWTWKLHRDSYDDE